MYKATLVIHTYYGRKKILSKCFNLEREANLWLSLKISQVLNFHCLNCNGFVSVV